MDILASIKKIYPDWKGVVWGNSYDSIVSNETETRSTPTIEELKVAWVAVLIEQKYDAIDVLRDKKIAAGVPYTFPDGITGTIQTRDDRDFRNINGLASTAMALSGQAVTLPFRDEEDRSHSLTLEQAISLGVAVTNRVSEIYTAAWSHKDALSALTTAEAIEAYDLTAGWPE